MTEISEKLNEAMKAKKNDIKSFVWKLAKKSDRTQEEILLVDATSEQLNSFYNHCLSMLYSKDKNNPGRYTLLDLIKEQKKKCTVELFLRQLDRGTITEGGEPYPRNLWLQDVRAYMAQHRDVFPIGELNTIPVSQLVGGLKPEYRRITIEEAIDGCLDQLGVINTKHITFNFILNMGIFFTPAELHELEEKDSNGKIRSRLEVLKERLRINPAVRLSVKPSGLNYSEFRAMVQLKSTKYSLLSTDQLTILEKKILPRLEKEIDYHISQWNERIDQIRKVAEYKGITLEEPDIA